MQIRSEKKKHADCGKNTLTYGTKKMTQRENEIAATTRDKLRFDDFLLIRWSQHNWHVYNLTMSGSLMRPRFKE